MAGPHGLDHFVRRIKIGDGTSVQNQFFALFSYLHAHLFEKIQHGLNVFQFGYVGKLDIVRSKQTGTEDRQGSVFCARDRDLALRGDSRR